LAFYEAVRKSFIVTLIRLFYRVDLRGSNNEPPAGALIVCSNHQSNADPFVLGSCIRRQLHYMAKKILFQIPVIGAIVRAFGAYPVDRDGGDVAAVRTTINLLERGNVVGIFPQGHRIKGRDPRMSKVKNGAAMAAFRAKCGVLPVAITVRNYKLKLFHKTIVNIGRFIPFEQLPFGSDEHPDYRAVSDLIFRNICDMLEDEQWRE